MAVSYNKLWKILIDRKMKNNPSFLICVKAFHTKGFVWTVSDPREYIACRRAGYFTVFEHFLPKEGTKK